MKQTELDQLCINTVRFLAVDAVENAKSGHPGAPLGAAPMAYVLFARYLKHNPKEPGLIDRDRFVLSAGHASALLYALLLLDGVRADDARSAQALSPMGEPNAGPPRESPHLGRRSVDRARWGKASAMRSAWRSAKRIWPRVTTGPGHEIFDHHTYVLASDGDMMEGVQAEAASLAGHLRLGKLIVLYDANHVTLSGSTSLAFTEDVGARYRAYGWHVQAGRRRQ